MAVSANAQPTSPLDPPQTVRVDGQEVVWHITPYLTDRWGNIIEKAGSGAPLAALEADAALLERLRAQMWDECTFVARLDGQFGVLYEIEICTAESEAGEPSDFDGETTRYLPEEEQRVQLEASLAGIAKRFPAARVALAPAETQVMGRLGMWAFVPDGAMPDEAEREALGMAMLNGTAEPQAQLA